MTLDHSEHNNEEVLVTLVVENDKPFPTNIYPNKPQALLSKKMQLKRYSN